jgi:uncharacterized protein YggT (Ycf19 family)
MGYFVTDTFGLILAALNVVTFILLIYIFLGLAAGERSSLFRFLNRILGVLLAPLRNVLPEWKVDVSSLILVVVLQVIAFVIKWKYC